MVECNSQEPYNIYRSLNDQQQFIQNKINKVKDYFVVEFKKRELMSKRFSKHIASFDYVVVNCFICSNCWHFYCIICNCCWSTSRDSKCKFSLSFSIFTGIVNKLLKQKEIKRKSIIKLLC